MDAIGVVDDYKIVGDVASPSRRAIYHPGDWASEDV